MIRKVVSFVVLFTLLFSSVAIAKETHTTIGKFFAAYTKEDIDKAVEFAVDHDVEALTNMALQGKIFMLEEGKAVYVQDLTWGGLAKLRFPGETWSFWTVREAIK